MTAETLTAATEIARNAARVLRRNYPSFSRSDAQQIAVFAIIETYKKTGIFDPAKLYMIGRNAVVDELRTLQPRRTVNDQLLDIRQPSPYQEPETPTLRRKVALLPPDERSAVVSIVMWETSVKDYAVAHGITQDTARDRVARGITRLRALL